VAYSVTTATVAGLIVEAITRKVGHVWLGALVTVTLSVWSATVATRNPVTTRAVTRALRRLLPGAQFRRRGTPLPSGAERHIFAAAVADQDAIFADLVRLNWDPNVRDDKETTT
jgi:hypothetical protein